MNLAALRTEFLARGFDYDPTGRADYWLNRAMQDVCGAEDWPFLFSTAVGTAPLSISDLRTIESVTDTTSLTKLTPLDRRFITDEQTDLSTAGTPYAYYVSGATTVSVYPTTGTDSITVSYWRVPDDLTADTDEPLIPDRFQLGAIIDGALVFAYQDSDNFEAAQQVAAMQESTVEMMRDQLLLQQHDRPDSYVLVTDPEAW